MLVLLLGSIKKCISNGQQQDRQKESVSVKVLHTVKLLVQRCSLERNCVQWYCYVIMTVPPIQHAFSGRLQYQDLAIGMSV